MSTNTLPLQDSDLDLLVKMAEAYVKANLCTMHIPHAELSDAMGIAERLYRVQDRRDTGKQVHIPALERLLHAQGKMA